MIPPWTRAAVLLLGLLPALSACAEDLGREWQTLDANSSVIVFPAPDL